MSIDTDRLVTIANELKSLDKRREDLLAELARIAGGVAGPAAVVRRGPGRPPGSRNEAKPAAPGKPATAAPRRRRRGGLTTGIVDFLKASGGAHTAGELVVALKRPKTKSGISTVSTTLVRLAKEGRVKKDKERGYRAA
jgi:hypothetical protein